MEAVFLQLVNLSINAGWLVLAVLVLRLLLRRAPRWICCCLWALVALRLLCPVSIESAVSLLPSAHPLPQEFLTAQTPEIASGLAVIDQAVNPVLAQYPAPAPGNPRPVQQITAILAWVWLAGVFAMLLYALVTSLLLRRRVATATLLAEGVKESEFIASPFVMGLIRPTIYLPYQLDASLRVHVLAHERAHIRRKDPLWKMVGFVLLSIYWFHPLLWVAYPLLCRDIEAACDKSVIRGMDEEARRNYAAALFRCGVVSRSGAAVL